MTSKSTSKTPITVARGDGIGPEIMDATLRILDKAGAALELEEIEVGEALYKQGHLSGIKPEAWDSLRRTRVFLKSPITTPQGGGVKSLNVTMRKTLGLFANVRPCRAYAPFVRTNHPAIDLVIVRENEEDLYAGIEHRQTDEVYQCLKLISKPGCERIVRFAFEYARVNSRKKVTCISKDNIMKLTDGIFHQVFNDIAPEYPEIETDHLIVDIGAARLADTPEIFDVIVTSNLYGDILSDIAAQVAGSVGLAGSSNIGSSCAMFEAIHGSAPQIAGQDIANPSGLLFAAVMMLVHIGQRDVAEAIHNAVLRTIEDGMHTGDIYVPNQSVKKVGTREFGDAVMARLGQLPVKLQPVSYPKGDSARFKIPVSTPTVPQKKELVGVDVFLHYSDRNPDALGAAVAAIAAGPLKLQMITNRGVKVWPNGFPETLCTDHWRCRFESSNGSAVTPGDVLRLLMSVMEAGLDFVKTEHLYRFDGEAGYSMGQGQ